jgi:hypothetical protein
MVRSLRTDNSLEQQKGFEKALAHSRTMLFAYVCSTAEDFARLLSRICSVVNSPPQTLQRQLGDAACEICGVGC